MDSKPLQDSKVQPIKKVHSEEKINVGIKKEYNLPIIMYPKKGGKKLRKSKKTRKSRRSRKSRKSRRSRK